MSFSNAGTDKQPAWMPKPELMYQIGEACGISGGEVAESAPITEEVDINPMLFKGPEEPPTYRRMTVGRSVTKRSYRMQEDGTLLWSSSCTSEYNAWERCCESWSKEEMYTEGYSKPSKFGNEYDNRYKRRAHFDNEMKFAHAKAETKAHVKTIRELAGMPTGYRTEDLKEGRLIFARVRRSREALQMETAARLSALSQGKQITEPVTAALFGPSEPVAAEPVTVEPEPTETPEPTEEPRAPEKSRREEMIAVFEHYVVEDLVPAEYVDSVKHIIAWLHDNPGAEEDKTYWPMALNVLKEMEKKIMPEGKISHGL